MPALPVKAIVVMAADHGVAAEGVSAYPQEVTRQMVLNFVRGGAAINVLARHAGARLVVVDMGVAGELEPRTAICWRSRIAPGTQNLARGPAMSRAQAVAALEAGIALARELAADGVTLLGTGEMGIGNTTAASALTAVLTGERGRGGDRTRHRRRRRRSGSARSTSIARGDRMQPSRPGRRARRARQARRLRDRAVSPGVVLGAAAARVPVVVDGLIAGRGGAGRGASRAGRRATILLASHRSVERGHGPLLAALGLEPLLDLALRLGEGTGAALAIGLVEAALRILHEMASFSAAGVADTGA